MKVVFKNVLCTTDLSDFSNMSVYYGAALARVFEATLHLCHVVDLPIVSVHGEAFTYPPDYAQTLKEDALRQMDTLMNPLQVKWVPHVEMGAIAHTVSDLVGMTEADLVISASHGRSGLKRLLLGSVTEQLLRSIRRPFLVVTAPEKRDDDIAEQRITRDTVENFRLKKILVGSDFSQDSTNAVTYGFSLAQDFQSELHLVHVVEPFAYSDALMPDPMTAEVRTDLDALLTGRLESLVPAEARNWCDVKTSCLAGRPHEELVKYAVLHAVDLIILGIRGRGLVETLLLGSTTDRVIRRVTCPVLAVGPAADAER
ncbi:MAG: universal stress protein [Desulfobacterales bacterium]|jgi:nucleotide-binding universal stress UspA family protein